MKSSRMALFLNWRDKGYLRPCYGIVDDNELTLTGRTRFLATDGNQFEALAVDVVLLSLADAPFESQIAKNGAANTLSCAA